jgi:aldehyde:ferredoxin oxidoreductase
MHLYHDGKISAKDTDGVAFERGSKEALMQTIDKVVFRKGFGDILANGPVALAKKLGPDAEKYLIHKKGFMPRTFDFRTETGTALGEAVSARGNSLRATTYHEVIWGAMETPEQLKAGYDFARKMFGTEKALIPWEYEGKPKALIYDMNKQALSLSLGFCRSYLAPSLEALDEATTIVSMEAVIGRRIISLDFAADRITSATGMPMDEKTLYNIAERIITTERAFNVRDGVTRKDDIIHDFYFTTPVVDGPQKGRKLDRKKFEKMKDEYYQLRGWDVATGVPSRKRLKELGLTDIAKSLEKLGTLPKPQKTET